MRPRSRHPSTADEITTAKSTLCALEPRIKQFFGQEHAQRAIRLTSEASCHCPELVELRVSRAFSPSSPRNVDCMTGSPLKHRCQKAFVLFPRLIRSSATKRTACCLASSEYSSSASVLHPGPLAACLRYHRPICRKQGSYLAFQRPGNGSP